MAELAVSDGDLVLHLSAREKVEAIRGDLRAPMSAVRRVEVLEDARVPALKLGFQIGTRIPRGVEVATVGRRPHRMFVAVHRDTPQGLRITFEGASYDEWIVGCADPSAVATRLGLTITE